MSPIKDENIPVKIDTNPDDIAIIKELIDSAEKLIRNEMNFLKYYNVELRKLNKLEYRCFENNNGLYKLILSVYATYEFTIKRMFEYVLEIIDKEAVKIIDLTINLKALYFREDIDDLRKKITAQNSDSKEKISKKMVKMFNHFEEVKDFSSKDNMIDSKSNLKFDVLCEIISYFDLEEVSFKSYESYVKALVHYRNNIAHGNQEFADSLPQWIMPINEKNYDNVCEKIIELINGLYNCIEIYINDKKYLKDN